MVGERAVPDQLLLLMVESVASEPRPETCPDGRERLGSVVMPEIDELAERRLSKRLLKVEVYTPPVTEPALPEIEPVMMFEKMFVPENVLLSPRSVEEAAVTVMSVEPSKGMPLMFLVAASLVAVPALPPMFMVEVAVEYHVPLESAARPFHADEF